MSERDCPIKLCIFDLNGTLATSFTDGPVTTALTGRREKLNELRTQGMKLAIATNQRGRIWRAATGNKKYPDAKTLADDLAGVIDELGMAQEATMIALYDSRAMAAISRILRSGLRALTDDDRETMLDALKNEVVKAIDKRFHALVSIDKSDPKPAPGMLIALMTRQQTDADHTLYVGDRPEDEQAAANAGCHFKWATEFFTPNAGPGPLIVP